MLLEAITTAGLATVAYHHVGYPLLLEALARLPVNDTAVTPVPVSRDELPTVTLIVPAHNEERVISDKLRNLAELDYPSDKLRIVIVCDGCTDRTVELARSEVPHLAAKERFEIVVYSANAGKVAVLNRQIAVADSEIIALSDTSSMLEPDALFRAASHFADRAIALVCPTYRLETAGSCGEQAYWQYQTRIKACEARVGAPMGAHGAFYLFRRNCWQAIPSDTINDDFMLPMSIILAGNRAVYDPTIVALEREVTKPTQEANRRRRIGAGNMQQLLRVLPEWRKLTPGALFVFLSGKGLRVMIPYVGFAVAMAVVIGSLQGDPAFLALAAAAAGLASIAGYAIAFRTQKLPRIVSWLGYLCEGHWVSLLGSLRYLRGLERTPWTGSGAAAEMDDVASLDATSDDYVPRSVAISKRALDIFFGLCALAVLIVLFIPIALTIKLTSPGPILYRQLRVGRSTAKATHLFYLAKFRTMRTDAEASTGAVWASKDDPRITAFGRFMRKTRLDELPQCINVLKGEMSVVGPRPERPAFFTRLEDAIPFYSERTYGLLPGITGLAQINQAYDQSIEDVRNKVLYDHAYAARLTNWWHWFRADIGIIFSTFSVMALGKGQ